MPKLPKATIDLTGVSINQIMNLDIDINKLSRGDLSRVVGRLVSASNKRIRNLAKTEIGKMSPAYQSRMERGGQFSTKGLSTDKLRNLFAETKGFLQLKTSSIKGWGDIRQEIEKSIGISFDTEEDSKKFWETYRRFAEGKNIPDKKTKSKYDSEHLQQYLAKRYSTKQGFGRSMDEVLQKLDKRFKDKYEEEERNDTTSGSPEEIGKRATSINKLMDENDEQEEGLDIKP